MNSPSKFPTAKATPEGKAETLRRRTERTLKVNPVLLTKSGHPRNRTNPL